MVCVKADMPHCGYIDRMKEIAIFIHTYIVGTKSGGEVMGGQWDCSPCHGPLLNYL